MDDDVCACSLGWIGGNCDVDFDECYDNNACGIHGDCIEGDPGTFHCACDPGYTGLLCATQLPMYPYGPETGDLNETRNDDDSFAIVLPRNVSIFGGRWDTVYVSLF